MVNNITTIQYNGDKKISIALMASFVILTIQYLILIYFNLLESSTGAKVQLMSKALVGLVFLYALPVVFKRSKIKIIKIYFIASFILIVHYAIFPENRAQFIGLLFPFFFMSLPAFIYTLSIQDFIIFKDTMKKSSYIVFAIGLILSILIFTGRAFIGPYSMSLSYYLLLPAILFLDEFLEEFSIIFLIMLSVTLFIILALGSRGSILCIGIYALLKFLKHSSKSTYLRVFGNFSLLSIGVITLVFMDKIIAFFSNLILSFGINSRSLILFSQSEIYLSGRDTIYKDVIAEILESPLLGIGILGDRRIVGGGYVHNFFIEVVGNFGLIIGFIICIGIVLLIIKSLLTKDRVKYNLTIIWMCLGFVHLMVSGSYLIDIKFWIFIGLIININSTFGDKKRA